MTESTLRRADAASMALLVLWTGMALGFALLVAPVVFKVIPSRDLAGLAMGKVLVRLDWAAWVGFGASLLLSGGLRWLAEIGDADVVGPLRLWTAGALVALLMCLASSFIFTPKLEQLRRSMLIPVEQVAPEHPDRVAYGKVHGFSRQMLVLRMLLGLGLAWGVTRLPRKAGSPAEA